MGTTVMPSEMPVGISRRANFCGAVSTSNRLAYVVPNLVEAMFTGFPGNSGETVRITIRDDSEKTVRAVD